MEDLPARIDQEAGIFRVLTYDFFEYMSAIGPDLLKLDEVAVLFRVRKRVLDADTIRLVEPTHDIRVMELATYGGRREDNYPKEMPFWENKAALMKEKYSIGVQGCNRTSSKLKMVSNPFSKFPKSPIIN